MAAPDPIADALLDELTGVRGIQDEALARPARELLLEILAEPRAASDREPSEALSAEALSPEALSPEALSPEALSAEAFLSALADG